MGKRFYDDKKPKLIIPSNTIEKLRIMKKLAILTTALIIVTIASTYFFLNSNTSSSFLSETSPLVAMKLVPSDQLNITQGGVTRLNVTLTSLNMNETTIPLSLVLQTYENKPLNASITREKLFSSTFTVNPIFLEPNDTVTSMLTLHVGDAAPSGKYTFLVELGNLQIHQLTGNTFDLAVAPSS